MKLQTSYAARTLAIALLASVLGFCYSITTQADSGARALNIEPRLLGTTSLRLLVPPSTAIPGDLDLGDACYGSVITRYVTATGGVRPYAYASPDIITVVDATSTINVLGGGVVTGKVSPPPANNFTDLAFQLSVSDSHRPVVNSLTQTAHINLVPSGANLFRFAQDRLNNGVLGQAYICKLETLSGKGTVSVGVVSGTLMLNGVPIGTGSSLDSIGLNIAFDGTVYGRPLKSGLVSFTAFAIDSRKRFALDRTNTVQNQTVTFSIADSKTVATDSTILSASVKGDTAHFNADTLSIRAIINSGGLNTTNLRNTRFAFLFGGGTYEGFLDEDGSIGTALHNQLVFPDGTILSGKVDTVNGIITLKLSRANLTDNLDAVNIPNRDVKRVAVGIVLHSFLVTTDTIEFQTKHVGNKFQLTYSIGHAGRPLGGGFQIYSIAGADKNDIAGNPGDAWTGKFLISPRFGIDDVNGGTAAFTDLSSIGVRIGNNFSQIIPVTGLKIKNNSIQLQTSGNGQSLSKFKLSTFAGSFVTNPLSAVVTGTPQAADPAAADTRFNLALDVNRNAPNASFTGEDAKTIIRVPVAKKWIDRNSKKPKP